MADSNSNRRTHNFIDLTGKRFGKWTVLGEAINHPSKYVHWDVACECGTKRSIRGNRLTGNRSQGCKACSKRHGMSRTSEHNTWKQMKQRCNNPNDKAFPRYGGNGIAICERWNSFETFYADMGPKPSASHSVDRIDGSKGYSPENCRWATPKEQSQNRDFVRMITFQGETLCLTDWATKVGIDFKTLYSRLNYGWSIEKTLTTPANSYVHMLEFHGETFCMKDWAAKVGITYRTLRARILKGWSIERALTEPVKAKS